MSEQIFSGVQKFDGAIFTKWFAWAQVSGGRYVEGPLRFWRWRARWDVAGLEAKLRRLPRLTDVPHFEEEA